MKLLIIAFAAVASLSAETVDFSFYGHQNSIDVNLLGSGSFVVPNGTVSADLSNITSFNAVLYDITASTNPIYAYDTYRMDASDLLQFSGTFNDSGSLEQLTFQTSMMDQHNDESSLGANWTPDGIQPMGNVGGFQVEFTVNSAVLFTPEPSYSFVSGFLLIGLGALKRRLSRRLS